MNQGQKIKLFVDVEKKCDDPYEAIKCSFVSINEDGIIVTEINNKKIYYPTHRILKIEIIGKENI